MRFFTTILTAACYLATSSASASEPKAKPTQPRPKRLLLIGQGPDNHPYGTHEYLAGMRILAQCLQPVGDVQTIVVSADGDWKEGPELIDGADGVVLFVSEGARWIHDDPKRLAALKKLAARGGGFACWHWGMGCRDAKFIQEYVTLFGGCHGGPDRKYKVVKQASAKVLGENHPIMAGVRDFTVDEEFYYTLKFAKSKKPVTPLIQVEIEGGEHTVSWAWERPDGGRSFGFSGGHFHDNWSRKDYRRLAAQAALWIVNVAPPGNGLRLKFASKDLTEPRPKPVKSR